MIGKRVQLPGMRKDGTEFSVEESVGLPSGSLLLFDTDGVIEARGAHKRLDQAELDRLMAGGTDNGHGPREVVDAIASAANEVQDDEPRGDIAVVALATR